MELNFRHFPSAKAPSTEMLNMPIIGSQVMTHSQMLGLNEAHRKKNIDAREPRVNCLFQIEIVNASLLRRNTPHNCEHPANHRFTHHKTQWTLQLVRLDCQFIMGYCLLSTRTCLLHQSGYVAHSFYWQRPRNNGSGMNCQLLVRGRTTWLILWPFISGVSTKAFKDPVSHV